MLIATCCGGLACVPQDRAGLGKLTEYELDVIVGTDEKALEQLKLFLDFLTAPREGADVAAWPVFVEKPTDGAATGHGYGAPMPGRPGYLSLAYDTYTILNEAFDRAGAFGGLPLLSPLPDGYRDIEREEYPYWLGRAGQLASVVTAVIGALETQIEARKEPTAKPPPPKIPRGYPTGYKVAIGIGVGMVLVAGLTTAVIAGLRHNANRRG